MAKLAHQCPTPFPSTQSAVRMDVQNINGRLNSHDRWQYNSEPLLMDCYGHRDP